MPNTAWELEYLKWTWPEPSITEAVAMIKAGIKEQGLKLSCFNLADIVSAARQLKLMWPKIHWKGEC